MLKRLWILTMLQLSNKMKFKITNTKRFIASIAMKILVFIIITAIIIAAFVLNNSFFYIPVQMNFTIFILFVTQVASIIACTNGLMTDLYLSKDNQILLSYPARHNEIFVSKLLVFYINEFMKNLFFLVPLLIGIGYINNLGIFYFLNIVLLAIILPLLPVLIAALLSIPIMYIRRFLTDKSLLRILLFFVAFVIIFVGFMLLLVIIPQPIRIGALFNSFIIWVTKLMSVSAEFALIYANIGKMMFGVDALLNYGILIIVVLALAGLVLLVSRPVFFSLATQATELKKKKAHKVRNVVNHNLFWTFIKKEWLLSIRNLNEMFSNYVLIIAFPFIITMVNYIYVGINRSSFGNNLVFACDIAISLLLATASNTASASAISVEGNEFILLKMAPSDTRVMCWAKIMFNLIFSTLIILAGFLVFHYGLPLILEYLFPYLATNLPFLTIIFPNFAEKIGGFVLPHFDDAVIWLIFTVVILVNFGHILMSFKIDLMNPKLSEYASTGSLTKNDNITKSITIGLIISVLFGIVSGAMLIENYVTGWIRIIAIAVAFLAGSLYLFDSYLKSYFIDIEF